MALSLRPRSAPLALALGALFVFVLVSRSSINRSSSASTSPSWASGPSDWSGSTAPSEHSAPSSPAQSLVALARTVEPFLVAWEQRTILSHGGALARNEAACPRWLEDQSNPDQINGEAGKWESMSVERLEEARAKVIAGVRRALAEGEGGAEAVLGNGKRGIVVAGGNADTMERLLIMLRILRNRHKSKLPVEVWAFKEELAQGGRAGEARQQAEAIGDVTFRELPSQKIQGIWKNFQIKGEAIASSSFSQVLYLDSDNIPLVDPAFLFDSPTFKKYGAVLWPDISKDGPRNAIWRLTGQTCIPQDWQLDSGQILIDKRAQRGLVAAAMLLAAEMQRDHDFWFSLSGGDKDTFRYAFYALQLPWTRAPHWLSSAGGRRGSSFCGHTMFQYGLSPDEWRLLHPSVTPPSPAHAPPLFVHANLLKHSGYTFNRGRTWTTIQRLSPTDEVALSELKTLNMVKARVDVQGIMCVGYSLRDGQGGGSGANVIEEPFDEAWGGMLKGFEDMYWDEGGKSGGFRRARRRVIA